MLGDIKISFVLLMAASTTLFIGSNYAGAHFSLFREMNRLSVPDWLAVHLKAEPELTWWVPVLFFIMGALGLNTLICIGNRVTRLISQRKTLQPGSFFHLLIPSIVHFLFVVIMLGHLTTFLSAKWQTMMIETGSSVILGENAPPLEVRAIEDLYFPETSALRDRISQTTVTFANSTDEAIELKYLHPVRIEGHFLFLDKAKQKKTSAPMEIAPTEDDETCNKAADFVKKNRSKQLLLAVKDPGFYIIISGLVLILCLMTWYFLIHERKAGRPIRENGRNQ